MKKIRVAIIGCGRMGDRHVNAYSKRSDVIISGVFDQKRFLARSIASKFKTKIFSRIEDIMEDSYIDAISICTPNSFHYIYLKMGIKSGKKILVEKPIVTEQKECDAINKIMKNSKSRIMVGHIHRFFPCNVALKKLLNSKRIGTPRIVNTFDFIPGRTKGQSLPNWIKSPELSGGGVFMTDLIHTVDKISWLMNSEVVKVYTPFLSNFITSHQVEDAGIAILWLKNGVTATCTHGCPSPGMWDMSTKIIGKKGEISLRFAEELKIYKNSISEVDYPFKGNYDKHSDYGFFKEISEFVQAVKKDREPSINHRDGIKAVKVVLSLYESYKKKLPIEIKS